MSFAVSVTLTERSGSREFTIRHRPEGGPTTTVELEEDGSVRVTLPDRSFTADFRQDPRALDPDHPLRPLAEISLGLLRGAHSGKSDFYDRARAELFGSRESEPGATGVTPTRDWVAFRHRRPDRPAERLAPRGVVVWVAAATSRDQAAEWAALLKRGTADELPWERVRSVLFDPDTAKARTSAEELRRSYVATDAPKAIHHVGFGAAGPVPAGFDRAMAIATALPSAAVLDPQARVTQVSAPAGLFEPETDGGVFLIAYPSGPTGRGLLRVVMLSNPHVADPGLMEAITERQPGVIDMQARVLGTVRLTDGRLDRNSFDTTLAALSDAVRGGTSWTRRRCCGSTRTGGTASRRRPTCSSDRRGTWSDA
ncbi:hypothetical protein ACFQ2B_02665 [Streptomyces stramineus]